MTSPIEWLQRPGTMPETWNPIRAKRKTEAAPAAVRGWFCVHVHDGCVNCYAERINVKRFGNGIAYKAQNESLVDIYLDEKTLLAPLRWKRPRTVFPCSMTDLYGPWVKDEWLDRIKAIEALTPQHTYIELTKRPARMRDYMTAALKGPWAGRAFRVDDDGVTRPETDAAWRIRSVVTDMLKDCPPQALNRAIDFMDRRDGGEGDGFFRRWPLPNVWSLVSISTQADAAAFVPELVATPAAIRGVSAEPLLAPIDLTNIQFRAIDWVIAGGESGPDARPMHPDWARSLRDQCQVAGTAFFFKQWGAWTPGENIASAPVRTEHAARWFGDNWQFYNVTSRQSEEMHRDDQPDLYRVGKARAGRLLDGRTHDNWPEPTP